MKNFYSFRHKKNDKERTIKMELGIASVAAITAIAYLLGMAVKATEAADKWIPII